MTNDADQSLSTEPGGYRPSGGGRRPQRSRSTEGGRGVFLNGVMVVLVKTQIIKVLYILMALAVNISLINLCFNNIIENNRVYGLNRLNRFNQLNGLNGLNNHRTYSE